MSIEARINGLCTLIENSQPTIDIEDDTAVWQRHWANVRTGYSSIASQPRDRIIDLKLGHRTIFTLHVPFMYLGDKVPGP
ncbi:hypothetical protein HYW41_05305 [Candidatus Daviesbacteria bacterium]|nr:hypothetical protein [Candidatus Daviesbacteria bacterium]